MQLRLNLDDATTPFAEVANGSRIGFDTTDLPDGQHTLRIDSVEEGRVTGRRLSTFTVRNGPGIAVPWLAPGDDVRGTVKLVINASDAGIGAAPPRRKRSGSWWSAGWRWWRGRQSGRGSRRAAGDEVCRAARMTTT